MHALEILFSELQGYCNPIREYKVLTCSHPCQCLGACTAACQGSPGQSPGWRAQVAAPEPSFCQAGQGGHLWNLHRHTAALFSRSTSPGPGIPLSSGSSPGFFPLSTIFGCCPLDQSSWCQILRCQPFWVLLTLFPGSCRRRGAGSSSLVSVYVLSCQGRHMCPWSPLILGLAPEMKQLLPNPHPPPAPTYFSLEMDFDEFSIMSSLVHMIVSPLALQSRDVVVTWLDCPEAKNPI